MIQVSLCTAPQRGEKSRPIQSLTDRVTDLGFGTALPGGFSSCSFSMAMPDTEAYEWYSNRLGHLILVHEAGQTVWEGRIEGIALQPYGVSLACVGYWSDLTNRVSYQFWASARGEDWVGANFFQHSAAGLPVIPWSNQIWQSNRVGNGIYITMMPNTFIEHDSVAFIFSLPVPPSGTDPQDFWQQPNTVRRLNFNADFINSSWDDGSGTHLKIQVYTTDDPYGGSWKLEEVAENSTVNSPVYFAEGRYTGDGAVDPNNQEITGLGFAPKVVIVKKVSSATNARAMIKSESMEGVTTARNVNDTTSNNGLLSLEDDGFKVWDFATTGRTNEVGETYQWFAFGGPGVFSGTYSGNGGTEQDITGHGFDPQMVWIINTDLGSSAYRTISMEGSTDSYDFFTGVRVQEIRALIEDGFTIGTDISRVNKSGSTYHYVAFAPSANTLYGKYVGSAAVPDNRAIPDTSLPFPLDMVLVKGVSNTESAWKSASGPTFNQSIRFDLTSGTNSNEIQRLLDDEDPGKFEVGGSPIVNSDGVDYHYVGMRSISETEFAIDDQGGYEVVFANPDVRGVMIRVNAGNGDLKTFSGTAGSARVEISDLSVRNFNGSVVPSEIVRRSIAGSDDNSPLHDHLSTRTLFIEETVQSELLSVVYEGTTVQAVLEQLGQLGDPGNLRSWYGAVWDGRMVHFQPRDIRNIKWRLSRRQLSDEGALLERSIENFWTYVQAFYRTSAEVIESSVVRHEPRYAESTPVVRRQVLDLGEAPVSTIARDSFFEDFKVAQPQAEIEVNGLAINSYGVPEPLWRIRAGDVFQVDDLFPGRYIKGADAIDPLRTFFIRETNYSVEDNALTLTPGWPAERLDILFANIKAVI